MCDPTCDGLWANTTDNYLGLKLIVGTQTYYGWASLSVDVPCFGKSASFTIKDYAYDKTPDHSIITGSKSGARMAPLSLSNDVIDTYQLHVYPNPVSNSATVSFSLPLQENVSIKIFDIAGRLVKILANTKMNKGVHQLMWNVQDKIAGTYFLRIEAGNYSKTEKVSVIK
jgi:hypothetical protein